MSMTNPQDVYSQMLAMQNDTVPIPGMQNVTPMTANVFSDMRLSDIATKSYRKTKLTKFQLALKQIEHEPKEHPHGSVEWYFDQTGGIEAIEAIGWWNPVHNGRPKPIAQMLLSGIPAPVGGRGLPLKLAGLMYFTPMICGRRRSRSRTSLAGLILLKHWSDRYQLFAPFFAAYHSKKAEKEITLECIDLAIGTLPPSFRRMHEQHGLNVAAKKKKEQEVFAAYAQREQQARANSLYGQLQAGQGQSGLPTSGLLTGLTAAQLQAGQASMTAAEMTRRQEEYLRRMKSVQPSSPLLNETMRTLGII